MFTVMTYRASGEILPLMLCMSLLHRLKAPGLIFYISNTPEGLWSLRQSSLLLLLIDIKMWASYNLYINNNI